MPGHLPAPAGADDLRGRLKWFLLGRVAVVSGFLAMVAAASLRSGRFDVPADQLLVAVIAIYAFSALSAILVPHLRHPAAFAYLQIAFDVLLVTGVIYLTGGVESPFAFLYSLPIINGAVLLFASGGFFAAACAALTYDALIASLAANAASAVPRPDLVDLQIGMRIATMNATFGLIAFLASVLTRRLHAAEQLLREKEAERDHYALLQHTLARTIGSGLITTDPDGRITSVDGVAEQLAGRAQHDMIGADIGSLFPPLRLTAAARMAFSQSSAAADPVEFVTADETGGARHLRCVAAPLANTFGHAIGALYVLQNVTPLKALAAHSADAAALDALCGAETDAPGDSLEPSDGLYGTSAAMARIHALIERVAASDASLLLTGESGTGKEMVARAVHARGPRRDKRFVAINCGAIPEHLMESELFGHVRGAFTGAVADRPGCFRAADGGTLFLDEIGELPLHLQVKLLRVLQERTFRPVGSETNVAVDVRIVAATNRDLVARVAEGAFREDLYYRLNVITVELPPLRERREDIPLLVRHFLRQFSDLHGRQVARFSVSAARCLLEHDYPGNIRELENIVEHAVALCDGETATEEHLPAYVVAEPAPKAAAAHASRHATAEPVADRAVSADAEEVRRAESWAPRRTLPAAGVVDLERDLAEYEKAILLRALDQAGGVKKRAAELLGINYRSLRHRLQKYGLGDSGDDSASVH
jgi:transcriptional regulator with PAS, ATPase and Fis domain